MGFGKLSFQILKGVGKVSKNSNEKRSSIKTKHEFYIHWNTDKFVLQQILRHLDFRKVIKKARH